MKKLQTIILVFYFTSSFGQAKTTYNIFSSNGDTTYWYKYQAKRMNKLSLPSLDTSSKIAYYRLWSGQQVIGIWQNNDGTIAGQLTTWADEVVPDHEKPTNRTFIQTKKLNPDTAKQIQQLFVSSNILSLPTEDSIKGWQRGWDGITYFIEYSTRNKYSFKSYWTP